MSGIGKLFRSMVVFAFWMQLSACVDAAPPVTPSPSAWKGGALRIALLANDLGSSPQQYQPMADVVALKLGAQGVSGSQLKVANDVSEISAWLSSGEADLFLGSSYPALVTMDNAQADPLLQCAQNGLFTYQSVIFAHKGSGINTLADLPGHLFAMTSPASSSGFMLPSIFMLEGGLTLNGKPEISSLPLSGQVGVVFSGSEETTLQWVLSGQVAAGVVDDFHFDVAFPSEAVQQLATIARTDYSPRCLVVARPGLPPALLQALKDSLVELSSTSEGAAALSGSPLTGFSSIPAAQDTHIQQALALIGKVQKISASK